MGHPYPLREIARQAGVSEATVDRVRGGRGGVRASTAQTVRQAIDDLDRQRTQLRLTGRTFLVDVVMQAPARFTTAVRRALEAELPTLRPAVFRARFHLRETASVAEIVALGQDMRRACRVIMQAHRALPGGIHSWPSSIQVVTPYNAPQPPERG